MVVGRRELLYSGECKTEGRSKDTRLREAFLRGIAGGLEVVGRWLQSEIRLVGVEIGVESWVGIV